MKKLAIIAAAFALPAAANAATITNGSFESASVDPGTNFLTLSGGSTAITGWTVGSGAIDYIGGLWQASDGGRSLDLSALNAGSIFQTLSTVAGQRYTVSFDLAGNPDAGPTVKQLNVSAGADQQDYSFDITGANRGTMNWSSRTFSFTALGTSTDLTFQSLTGNPYGPALDNVSIAAAVPEPAAWAMMILGVGFTGGALRTRRSRFAIA